MEVSQVRLVFNVDAITAVSVSANWLYLTSGPTSVVRINLDSPTAVTDIRLPKKHAASAGRIRLLQASPNGKSLFCVTTSNEHFFYSEHSAAPEFKHLAKLKGTPTLSCAFFPKVRGCLLLGTRAGTLLELLLDSSGNETYFKRDLRSLRPLWTAPAPITGICVLPPATTAKTGSAPLRRRGQLAVCAGSGVFVADLGDSAAEDQPQQQEQQPQQAQQQKQQQAQQQQPDAPALRLSEPTKVFDAPGAASLGISPDAKTLAVSTAAGAAFCRLLEPGSAWQEIALVEPVAAVMASNFHVLAVSRGSGAVTAVNVFDRRLQQRVESPALSGGAGCCADLLEGTFWAFSADALCEIRLPRESEGMWRVLAQQGRFEEALDVADSRQARLSVQRAYGESLLRHATTSTSSGAGSGTTSGTAGSTTTGSTAGTTSTTSSAVAGARLLGLSDMPLERAFRCVAACSDAAVPALLLARLSVTKSRAQQIMLTSWLVMLDELSVLDGRYAIDLDTVREILRRKGRTEEVLALQTPAARVGYLVAVNQWSDALASLHAAASAGSSNEDDVPAAEIAARYSTVLLQNAPAATIETWLRMDLDAEPLLPGVIAYAERSRGPGARELVLRFLLKSMRPGRAQPALFNTVVRILCAGAGGAGGAEGGSGGAEGGSEGSGGGAESAEGGASATTAATTTSSPPSSLPLLAFLKTHAHPRQDLDVALRSCLDQRQHGAAIYLYTLMGLFEDAVKLCLEVGGAEMFERAVDIVESQPAVNEELRKHLLRAVAQTVIRTLGPQQASKFVGLLPVGDLLANFPDFETLSELAPEIVRNLEQTNAKLSALEAEIDETVAASVSMESELQSFSKRSVLIEPGEQCFRCGFPLVTRKFVVFPCQHGFHYDCVQKTQSDVTKECVLCCVQNVLQIEEPLSAEF